MAKFVMTKARLKQRRKAAKSPKRKGDVMRRSLRGLPRTPERIAAYYRAFSKAGVRARQIKAQQLITEQPINP